MTTRAISTQDFGAGFIAFLVVAALSVALYFLIRSMNRHLRKVPASFDPPVRDGSGSGNESDGRD